jgi:hypothetical protein
MHPATCCLQSFVTAGEVFLVPGQTSEIAAGIYPCTGSGLHKYLMCLALHISAGIPWVNGASDVHTARNCVAGPQGIRHTSTVHLSG